MPSHSLDIPLYFTHYPVTVLYRFIFFIITLLLLIQAPVLYTDKTIKLLSRWLVSFSFFHWKYIQIPVAAAHQHFATCMPTHMNTRRCYCFCYYHSFILLSQGRDPLAIVRCISCSFYFFHFQFPPPQSPIIHPNDLSCIIHSFVQ